MAKFQVTTLTPTIGAVVEGVDLSKPLDAEQFEEIHQALLKHQVIFFEDQHITLFDEVEYGLEPHRIARLIKHIRSGKSRSQIWGHYE